MVAKELVAVLKRAVALGENTATGAVVAGERGLEACIGRVEELLTNDDHHHRKHS